MVGKIHSKDGQFGEIEVLRKVGDNDYLVQVQATGIKCHAIFNPFVGCFYVDDLYAVEEE